MKISSADVQQVFNYLDKNQDGYITYAEFCYLSDEKRLNLDIFEHEQKAAKHAASKSVNNTFLSAEQDDEMERLERMSMASNFYQGFKSKRLKGKFNMLGA